MSWIIYAILSAIAASLVAIFGKIGISKVDSTLATSVRAVVMAVFLLLVAASLGKFRLLHTIDRSALTYIILSGIAGAISWLFYFVALRHGPTSGVAALDRLSVVFVFILAVLFLKEQYNWWTVVGAGLVAGGAVLMSLR